MAQKLLIHDKNAETLWINAENDNERYCDWIKITHITHIKQLAREWYKLYNGDIAMGDISGVGKVIEE